ncbi:DUF4157 domain-containing protein [Nitrogeniibacter mangrovi]|uniref:DUF4157 domain-containing protein n=1 Tax=Nitrogeniibacter mangrovi TaxID=2016596 RepID=A0A6C1B1W4_9RHOO|nr:DUF4157 domain-containing protein [Nitrogeniibacter mangrovi]QID17616.1 DUF4157 domain-containing protein [Nitrogeniibacter mangrovi]
MTRQATPFVPSTTDCAASPVLQRRCACGGSAGTHGECEACQRKHALGASAGLRIGPADDALERDADRTAARVLGGDAATPTPAHPGQLRRRATPGGAGATAPASVHTTLGGHGTPLPAPTRRFFESRFGHDFARVRIHDDAQAAASAREVAAHAYTVGTHVVFARGRYAPDTRTGRELLAHELAHVVQQSGGGRRLSRDPDPDAPASDDATFEASTAEASCDMGALCRLSVRAPAVVTRARLLQAWRACHPGIPITSLVGGNPCLTPNFGRRVAPPAPGPRRAPAGPRAAPAPSAGSGSGSGGGLSLPSTTIHFSLGPAAFTIDLPASVAIQLPVPFRGARRVVFALNASPSEFSFTATINAVPHVRIIARAGITTEGRGSAGLTVQTTRTTCQAVSPAAARAALSSAGNQLRDAIRAVQNPPAPDPDASELSRTFAPHMRYADVVSAIAHLHSEIERVGAPCREVPVFSAEFGAQGPLTTPDTPPGPTDQPPSSYVGGSLKFHF